MQGLPDFAGPHLTAGKLPRENERGPEGEETMHAVRSAILIALIALPAGAAERTLINDSTGHDCTVNQDTVLYVVPDLKARVVTKLAELTVVHVVGGRQFGPPVAYPNTEDEFARTWLQVHTRDRKAGWAPSGVITCPE
jgi:hypothetical protein